MLRSIKKAFDIIKAEDAETAITVHTIRTWCKQGKIKCLTAGNKVLVDMQSLLDYIAIKTDNTTIKKNKRRSRRNEETRSQNSIKMANRSIYDKTRCYYVH